MKKVCETSHQLLVKNQIMMKFIYINNIDLKITRFG